MLLRSIDLRPRLRILAAALVACGLAWSQDAAAFSFDHRPPANHITSATTDAATAIVNAPAPEMRPSSASAPATIIVGTDGMGRPSCCSSTFRPTSATPWRSSSSRMASMVSARPALALESRVRLDFRQATFGPAVAESRV